MSQNCFSLNNAWNSIGCDVNFKVTSQFSICEDNLNHLLYPCVPLCHEWARHIGGNATDTFFFFIMLHFNRSCPWPSNLLSWETLASTCVCKLRSNNQKKNAKLEAQRKNHCFLSQDSKKRRNDYINCDIKKGDIIRKYQEFCEINRKYNTTSNVKYLIADPIYSHKHHRNILAFSKWDASFSFLLVEIQARWAVVSRLPDVGFQCRSDVC